MKYPVLVLLFLSFISCVDREKPFVTINLTQLVECYKDSDPCLALASDKEIIVPDPIELLIDPFSLIIQIDKKGTVKKVSMEGSTRSEKLDEKIMAA